MSIDERILNLRDRINKLELGGDRMLERCLDVAEVIRPTWASGLHVEAIIDLVSVTVGNLEYAKQQADEQAAYDDAEEAKWEAMMSSEAVSPF